MRENIDTIFWDVDTQIDFMLPTGALYIEGAEKIIPNLVLLTAYAKENKIKVFGSVDRHYGTRAYSNIETELQRNSGQYPDHCMNGTRGELKIDATTLCSSLGEERIDGDRKNDIGIYMPSTCYGLGVEDGLTLVSAIHEIHDEMHQTMDRGINYEQPRPTYFEKQTPDVFSNETANALFGSELLGKTNPLKAIIYGVATDVCVIAAVEGLQKRDVQCYVVEDAIKGLSPESEQKAIQKMKEWGAKFITTNDVLENRI